MDLATIAASVLASGALTFVFREWISARLRTSIQHEYDAKLKVIEHDYSAKLQIHKAELDKENAIALAEFQGKNAIEVEKARAALQFANAQNQFRYERLHEKSAETTAEVHERLQALYWAVRDYTNPMGMPDRVELREKANKAFVAFFEYFPSRRIFLPKKLASEVGKISDELYRSAHTFAFVVDGKDPNEAFEGWTRAWSILQGTVPLLTALEDAFRARLGMDEY